MCWAAFRAGHAFSLYPCNQQAGTILCPVEAAEAQGDVPCPHQGSLTPESEPDTAAGRREELLRGEGHSLVLEATVSGGGGDARCGQQKAF